MHIVQTLHGENLCVETNDSSTISLRIDSKFIVRDRKNDENGWCMEIFNFFQSSTAGAVHAVESRGVCVSDVYSNWNYSAADFGRH